MDIIKYNSTEILAHIRHDIREKFLGKNASNESIDPELTSLNKKFVDRGRTAEEINAYRKDFESQIFKYNRKNLVHAVELCIQCPADCPEDQHEAFFDAAFDWFCGRLPAGKDCIYIAEVHRDEHKYIQTEDGLKDISKEHLHIQFVPAVEAGERHKDFKYRLNADALTKKAVLRDLNPSLQAELDKRHIQATVYQKKEGAGKTVKLTVKQLKEITNKTGVVIDHTLTIEELGQIIVKNKEVEKILNLKEKQIEDLGAKNEKLIEKAKAKIHEKNEIIADVKEALKAKEVELEKAYEKIASIEATKEVTHDGWGSSSGWGKNFDIEEEKVW